MVASAAAAAARNAASGSSGAGAVAAVRSSPVAGGREAVAGGWEAEARMDVASSSGRMALKVTVCSPGDSASSGEAPPDGC
ncbi:hypothetical protein [Streptosporangium canum]|uniref:hypothetical protein n=1 Tax=Streptosporangium canum TaxID=324952 RepID=UPI000B89E737|nr:hypothetical protein [Streptosporangium canum]